MRVIALVLGAGLGARLGAGLPKGMVRIEGRTLLEWSVAALAAAPQVDAVLPVIPPGTSLDWSGPAPGPARVLGAVAGGADRQASLACGLAALERDAPDAEWVLVHDAARCLVEPGDVEAVLAAARRCGAALPVVPLVDTLKEVVDGRVLGTIDRSRFGAAQTPQAFRRSLLRDALERARREAFVGTDCASLIERTGAPVCAVAGRPENFKVTTAADLERAALALRLRRAAAGAAR